MHVMGRTLRRFSFGLIILVLAWRAAVAQQGSAAALDVPGFQEGLEKLSVSDFEGAYLALRGINRHPTPAGQSEKAEILRTVIALGETVAHVRLLHAYASQLARPESPLRQGAGADGGVAEIMQSYVRVYREKVGRWADRLAKGTGTITELSREVPVSITYPGVRDLPSYVQQGFDRLQIVREGIVPVPSQVANIEQAEEYAAVLAAFYLAMDREFILPMEEARLQGTVHRSHLLFYSALWLANVADVLHAVELRKAATDALDVVLSGEASKPGSVLDERARKLLRRLEGGPDI